MIKLITMTGADDSIRPQDLLPISEKFPRVEWGILLSNSKLVGELDLQLLVPVVKS